MRKAEKDCLKQQEGIMTTIKQTEQAANVLLKQTHCYSRGQKLEYSLFGRSDGKWDWFCIAVKGFGEEAGCEFSNDLSSALRLFDRLCEGEVPPCTLEEIVQDQLSVRIG